MINIEKFQPIKDGGPVMWIILVLSVIAVYVFTEKWFFLHRQQVNAPEVLKGLFNVLKRNRYREAISLCDNTPGPIAKILLAAINAYHDDPEDDIEQCIEDAAMLEIPKLRRNLTILGTIGYISPLLGILGTGIGMMKSFATFSAEVSPSVTTLSNGIYMALLTTIAGLCVAIPCYIANNYLASRIDNIIFDMEYSAASILQFFKRQNKLNGLKIPIEHENELSLQTDDDSMV
ncbi:MotA/TolQ/ExbB proton channel family protein [Lentisphaerota bacterium WC36G]|nr:MotA/TolQ/ExbB proton channel family protein [Lentisphaerae bacterium WC36]